MELAFLLDVQDEWPPVSVEYLPCNKIEDGYIIRSPPLFIKNISVGDVIFIEQKEKNKIISWGYFSKSNRSTMWVLAQREDVDIVGYLKGVREFGCNTVLSQDFGIASVDIPDSLPIKEIDKYNELFDDCSLAFAYPSFRHQELS